MAENRLKEYRHAKGMTLEQLAEKSGVPISTISDIERGAEPRVVTAVRLSRALKTSVEKLWPLDMR